MMQAPGPDTCNWQVTWFDDEAVHWVVEFFDSIGAAHHRIQELDTDTDLVYLSELKLEKVDESEVKAAS